MPTNKYERDFTEQAHLKRPGRIDLRLFQYLSTLGDGFGGLQYMMHKMIGGVLNKFVIEGCLYNGTSVAQGYILYEGKVVEVGGEVIAVASGEWLYLDSDGNANVTSTENVAMANCMIYMKEADATPHDLRFRNLENIMNIYQLTVNQDIDLYGDHIDLHDGNLDDVATIDGGGDAVQMDDNLNMNSKDLNNIGANDVNINSLIQVEIDQVANINAVTISNTQWGYLGELNQPLKQADSPTFGNVTVTTDIGVGNDMTITGEIVFPSATIHSSGTEIHIHPNIGNADGNLILHPVGSNTASVLFVRNSVTGNYGDFIIKVSGTTASLESALGGAGTAPTTLNMNDADWDNINIGDGSATMTLNAVSISAVQFGYVGDMDQEVGTDDAPSFAGLTSTGTVIITGQNINSVANIYLADDIIHVGDTDNLISFGTDTQTFQVDGGTELDISNAGVRIGGTGQRVTTISNSIVNDANQLVSGAGIYVHSNSNSNPHTVTLAQLTPGAVDDDIDMNGKNLDNVNQIFIDRSPANTLGSGIVSNVTLGATVTIGDALYIDSSGKYSPTDADATATMPCCAIALEAGSADQSKNVLLFGYYRNDTLFSGFSIGNKIYISTTIGLFTNSPPSGSGDVVQFVGKIIDDGSGNKVLHFVPDITEIEIF